MTYVKNAAVLFISFYSMDGGTFEKSISSTAKLASHNDIKEGRGYLCGLAKRLGSTSSCKRGME